MQQHLKGTYTKGVNNKHCSIGDESIEIESIRINKLSI